MRIATSTPFLFYHVHAAIEQEQRRPHPGTRVMDLEPVAATCSLPNGNGDVTVKP